MKLSELTAEAIFAGIEKSAGELAIMNHQMGYNHIAIKLDGVNVVDFWLAETTYDYFRAEGWHRIAKVGTGSCDCNCDACSDGEDPEEWAGDEAYCMEEYIEEMISQTQRELEDYVANCEA